MGGGFLDLVPIWTAIIGMAVFFYVLLDGFDLGVGILYNFAAEKDRAMVMKRYPNGIDGEFFFMKRAPSPRASCRRADRRSGRLSD